jgi:tetratricopeptide (TPR) repeat protein
MSMRWFAVIISVCPIMLQAQTHLVTTAETKATAAEQLAYARRLADEAVAIPPGDPHIQAFLKAITAYEVVPSHWPADTDAGCTAREQQALLFMREQIFMNVVHAADQALNSGCRQKASLNQAKGLALARLGRTDEAEDALKAARNGSGFGSLAAPEKLAVDNALASFYEKKGDDRNAVKYLREAAGFAGPLNAVAILIRSADANERLNDVASERADLAALDDALSRAHAAQLDPGEVVALRQLENNVARKHQKIGH